MQGKKDVFRVPAPKFVSDSTSNEKQEAPQSVQYEDNSSRSLALKAASTMVGQVAPAQLERAVTESAAYIYSLKQDQKQQDGDQGTSKIIQSIQLPDYQVPDWGGPPSTSLEPPYSLEIIKSGQIINEIPLKKTFYSFGKLPDCDVKIEHPTCSRFHAVLQFNNSTNECFLWDNASTHGTYLNKKRIKQGVYVPAQVGDILWFGMSTRKYVVNGPDELRPEEGLNRAQKKQLQLLKMADKIKEKDKMRAEVQMQAALKGEVNWGMKEDAFVDEGDADSLNFDWRSYADVKGLTEKQEKISQKIRQKEWKIQSLEKENKRIKQKSQKELGLTPGQAATLARNEQGIDRLQEEKEEMEEILIDSIKDSIQGKKRKAEEEANKKNKGKRQKVDSDDDEHHNYDDDEDFFDRTEKKSQSKQKQQKILSPEMLYGEKSVLQEELKIIDYKLKNSQDQKINQHNDNILTSSSSHSQDESGDQLDTYMHYISQEIKTDDTQKLLEKKQNIEKEIFKLENLLKITDPQQYYKPGSKIAEAAKAKAIKEKEIKLKKQQLEKKQQKEHEKISKMDEFVEEEQQQQQNISEQNLQNNLNSKKNDQKGVGQLEGDEGLSGGLEIRKEVTEKSESKQNTEKIDAKQQEIIDDQKEPERFIEQQAKEKVSSGLLSREQVAQMYAQQQHEKIKSIQNEKTKIETQLEEELQLLSRLNNQDQEVQEFETQKNWKPPKGQTGDGRQKLNDKLGY